MKAKWIIPVLLLVLAACGKDGTDDGNNPGGNPGGGTGVVPEGLNMEVFSVVNLNTPGLETVRTKYTAKDYAGAAADLLRYYRNRMGVVHPDVNLVNVTIGAGDQKIADESLNHQFYAHSGYQPSFNYGADINWELIPTGTDGKPIVDNELRWQLHRHKWFIPLGKAYRVSGNEKYAKAWMEHYLDWIKKNPMPTIKLSYSNPALTNDQYTNMRYAWRPLEVSTRLEDQLEIFLYFKDSQSITPEFFSQFLVMYYKHAEHIMGNFSASGNHLLFEAQRMIYAGTFFKEFSSAAAWRSKGVQILNTEIETQVMDDGMQYELDFGYHMAAINIFIKGLHMSQANGYGGEFPATYSQTIEKMTEVQAVTMFPDYTQPMFSDNKQNTKSVYKRNFNEWSVVFPQNNLLKYMGSERTQGTTPGFLSKAFASSGFYVMRSGWNTDATMMVLKAGPKAFWHNQPDNGTFELWRNGRNFFPDSGCYVYEGDAVTNAKREWFRQTKVHNTLTLGQATITGQNSQLVKWSTSGETDICVTENQSYTNLKHRRSVFFVNRTFFVIVDEATGSATGKVELNWNMGESTANVVLDATGAHTTFSGSNNLIVKTVSPHALAFAEQEGRTSSAYNVYTVRKAYNASTAKSAGDVRFITVLYPVGTWSQATSDGITASFIDSGYSSSGLSVRIGAGGQTYNLSWNQ